MPSLEAVHKAFQQQPFTLLTIDVQESAETVSKLIERTGFTFPVLLDTDGAVAGQYGVRAHPVAYFVNAEGHLVSVVQGYKEWDSEEMHTFIASLLPDLEGQKQPDNNF